MVRVRSEGTSGVRVDAVDDVVAPKSRPALAPAPGSSRPPLGAGAT